MIPIRLSLTNFLCYRDNVPTLDFTGIHVACLCGPNGHGKSALLDAITWALWGRARSRTNDELISYGADECRVDLDFSSRGQEYRVTRSHDRAGRRRSGSSGLQLALVSGGVAAPLTGNVMRETQARIDKTVGMDYDTFVNSALLVQGRADEFTRRTPAERKTVLGKILGLETYDRLQVRAKERRDRLESTAHGLEASIDRIRLELEQSAGSEDELALVSTRLAALEQQLALQNDRTSALDIRIADLRRRQLQLRDSVERLESLPVELEGLKSAEAATREQVQQFETLIGQSASIRDGAARLAAARRRFEDLEQSRAEFDSLEREKTALRGTIQVRKTRLESDIEELRRNIDRLTPKAQACPGLEEDLRVAQEYEPVLAVREKEINEARAKITKLSVKMGQIQGSVERFTSEGKELASKLELLRKASDDGDAVCPLCQTPLREDGCLRLEESYTRDIEFKRKEFQDAKTQLTQLEAHNQQLGNGLPLQERELAEAKTHREVRLKQLAAGIEESRLAAQELEQSSKGLAKYTVFLNQGGYAEEEAARLRSLEERSLEMAYDDNARQSSYREIQELEGFALQVRLLDRAETEAPGLREALDRTVDMIVRRGEELDNLRRSLADDEAALAGLPALESELEVEKTQESAIQQEIQTATTRRGYLQGQVDLRKRLSRDLEEETRRLVSAREEFSLYHELTAAYGKQGIQAMLIETVVPRIEDEANELLGRMTDHRMNVKLETLKEPSSGKGAPRETLEILVSDELGPRSYEMYSGGEAFRVNLALRIALSKVLAQRMGAPLPTLFIDEGFGTQDTVGRERVLDVISAIGDEFEKVIVITHLDDLKEAFPVRIEVLKEDNSSSFCLT